jgi:two-component system, sensor histidine kinase and response regulator
VDEDVLSQEVASGMLAELPVDVILARDGSEAVRRAADGGLDLILMDVQMPVMDGLSATRAIRALPACATLPIIAMSANAFPEDRQRGLEAGMNAHVPKPVDFDMLHAALAHWLPAGLPPVREPDASPESGIPVMPAAIRAIDDAEGLRYFGGRADAYHRMLQRFVTVRGGDALLLRATLAAGHTQEAVRIAHSLKSMAATLGARTLRRASADVEGVIGEGNAEAIAAAVDVLEQCLREACADIARRFSPAAEPS